MLQRHVEYDRREYRCQIKHGDLEVGPGQFSCGIYEKLDVLEYKIEASYKRYCKVESTEITEIRRYQGGYKKQDCIYKDVEGRLLISDNHREHRDASFTVLLLVDYGKGPEMGRCPEEHEHGKDYRGEA